MQGTLVVIAFLFFGLPLVSSAQTSGEQTFAKIVVHLEEHSGDVCDRVFYGFSCSDNAGLPALVNVHGELEESYYAYLLVLDIIPDYGLTSAVLGISYDERMRSGVDIFGWTSCADSQTLWDWPESGSSLRLTYDECAGTTPDSTDAEGDGFVVLGALYVYAYSGDILSIDSGWVESCDGIVTEVLPDGPTGNFVSLGAVGFDQQVYEPCMFRGITDEGCEIFFVESWCCGADSLCVRWPGEVSRRACENVGGEWMVVSCELRATCETVCLPVPTHSVSWGRLKALYK